MASLRIRVEGFIARDEDPLKTLGEFYELLEACVRDGTAEGMVCVRRLFEACYSELATSCVMVKEPAAAALLIWHEAGVQALVDGMASGLDEWNPRLGVALMARTAAGAVSEACSSVRHDGLARFIGRRATMPGMAEVCRQRLIQAALSFEADDDVAELVGRSFSLLLPLRSRGDQGDLRRALGALARREHARALPLHFAHRGPARRRADVPTLFDRAPAASRSDGGEGMAAARPVRLPNS